MRSDSDLHEPRTDAEQSETGDDLCVSFESRLPYYVHQLQPNRDYSGVIDDWTDEEARAIFEELFKRFHVLPWDGIQLPPAGLPGFAVRAYDRDEQVAELLLLGMGYLKAIVFNERRAMHLRWQEAQDFIRTIKHNAEEWAFMQEVREVGERQEAKEAAQKVYFIAAASGPIKIGIAVSPETRLRGLQTGHHEKLELLATCEGGQTQERAYHEIFAARRMKGEWFERCPEIEGEIERLNRHAQ